MLFLAGGAAFFLLVFLLSLLFLLTFASVSRLLSIIDLVSGAVLLLLLRLAGLAICLLAVFTLRLLAANVGSRRLPQGRMVLLGRRAAHEML